MCNHVLVRTFGDFDHVPEGKLEGTSMTRSIGIARTRWNRISRTRWNRVARCVYIRVARCV